MPTPDREKLRWLALVWGAGIGPVTFRRLIGQFGSARAVLQARTDELELPGLRLTPEQIRLIAGLEERLGEFQIEAEELRAERVGVLCDWEDDYPELLRDVRSAPPVICMAGRVLAEDGNAIAIVGTRTPTDSGAEMARGLARAFAEGGTTVVSGLARGCDTAAHVGALEGGGRTIAVLGSGILRIHPRENVDLAREASQHGAGISEQPPQAHPNVGRLMARNRLQSALSRGVIVVQAREEGGALEPARRALEQRRLV